MLLDRFHFHFFNNREISSLYISLGLLHFGEGLISVFVPIYFWGIGFPLWKIFFFYFINSVYFLFFSFAFLPLVRRMSDKLMMFISIPSVVLYFSGLGFIGDIPFLFYVLPAFLSLSALLFNVGYHIDFSSVADDHYIGKEVGMRFTIASLMQLAGPFLGGILITLFGFQSTFLIGVVIMICATLPLFLFPKRKMALHLSIASVTGFLKNTKLFPFTLSGIGYAVEKEISRILWPLFIFFVIGSIEKFGAIISIGLLGAMFVTLFAGFLSDVGKRRKVLSVATTLFSFIWFSRPFFIQPFAVVTSTIAGNMADASRMVPWSAQYYKIAHAVSDASSFILSREVLYHISRIIFYPLLMFASVVFSQNNFFVIAFIGAGLFSLLLLFANKVHTSVLRGNI